MTNSSSPAPRLRTRAIRAYDALTLSGRTVSIAGETGIIWGARREIDGRVSILLVGSSAPISVPSTFTLDLH